MPRANTLEDIGRLAVAAARATSAIRAQRCETEIRHEPEDGGRVDRCYHVGPDPASWCAPCRERMRLITARRRAKNTLLVAVRSYVRRISKTAQEAQGGKPCSPPS